MIGSLKHINPKTKILFFAIILIMLPGAILSYLGLQSIDQNRENLRTSVYAEEIRLHDRNGKLTNYLGGFVQ